MGDFRDATILGRTGLRVGRIGFGSSYGAPSAAYEGAFDDYGCNLFYWGSIRRAGMRDAIRAISARAGRDRLVVALQSYDHTGFFLRRSVESGLRRLATDFADLLILGWWNASPPARVLDAAGDVVRRGLVRFLALSSHHRPFHGSLAADSSSPVAVQMFRYNAAHRGAEEEIFPALDRGGRPGTLAYTATRWGTLLDPEKMPPGEAPLAAADCYRFALSRPEIDVCLVGPANRAQAEEATRALDLGPLTPEEHARALRIGDHVRRSHSRN